MNAMGRIEPAHLGQVSTSKAHARFNSFGHSKRRARAIVRAVVIQRKRWTR
jgi:hypothetical protein